jgi:cyclase
MMREITNIPLIASGGAGSMQHFADVFTHAHVDGALAASVFHKDLINIPDLKQFLKQQHIHVR